jgi:hypothetical protein
VRVGQESVGQLDFDVSLTLLSFDSAVLIVTLLNFDCGVTLALLLDSSVSTVKLNTAVDV